ncbi:helicase RepA family protein [Chromobacterium haemolyticum]|nr:helicase RepA family protein [Chromobacterium haemolyticum]
MSLALNACKKLQSMLHGLVLLVHHTGKDGSRGMRGHSSLFAAMDSVIEIMRDGDRRGWRVTKAKDGKDNCESYFRLQVVDLGVDEDGDPVSSCIVRPDESPDAAVRKVKLPKGGNQRIVYETLKELLRTSQYRGLGGAPSDRPCLRVDELIQTSGERLVCDQSAGLSAHGRQ